MTSVFAIILLAPPQSLVWTSWGDKWLWPLWEASVLICRDTGRVRVKEKWVTCGLMVEGRSLLCSKHELSLKVNIALSWKKACHKFMYSRGQSGDRCTEIRGQGNPRCSLNNGLTEYIFLTISRCEQQSHMGDLFLLQQKSIGHDTNILFQEKSNSTKSSLSRKFKEKQFLLSVLMNTIKW